jgi:hypothetical protein
MSDFDLDRLGEMWRQDPEPAEIEHLRATARAVSRRARMAQFVDTAGAVVVGAALVAIVIVSPQPGTFAAVAAALLLMLFSVLRNRKLREAEIRMLTGTTEQMLDQSIERLVAKRKRMRFNLFSTPLLLPIGIWLISTRDRGYGDFETALAADPTLRIALVAIVLVFLLGPVIVYLRPFLRSRAELEQLVALRDVYRQEQSDRP